MHQLETYEDFKTRSNLNTYRYLYVYIGIVLTVYLRGKFVLYKYINYILKKQARCTQVGKKETIIPIYFDRKWPKYDFLYETPQTIRFP